MRHQLHTLPVINCGRAPVCRYRQMQLALIVRRCYSTSCRGHALWACVGGRYRQAQIALIAGDAATCTLAEAVPCGHSVGADIDNDAACSYRTRCCAAFACVLRRSSLFERPHGYGPNPTKSRKSPNSTSTSNRPHSTQKRPPEVWAITN